MAVDAVRHVFPRRHQFACAAGRFGEGADERFGHRAADADGEDAVTRSARLRHHAAGVPHLAVGDQQQVAAHAGFAGQAIGRPQRGPDLGTAQVGVQAAHEAARVRQVGGGRRHFAAEQDALAAAERDDVEQVSGAQAVEDPLPGDPHLRDRVAAHRPGAVHDDLEAAGRGAFLTGQRRAEARQHHPIRRVPGQQRARLSRGGAARFQHHVAVHRRGPRDFDHRLVSVGRDRKGMRWRGPARPLQDAAHRDLQPEATFGVEGELRRLVRIEAAGGRGAVARGDGGGHHEPHQVAVPAQQQPVAEADGRRLARTEVADVGGIQSRLRLFQAHRRVAVGNRVLVPFFSLALGDDRAGQRPILQLEREVQQHGIQRQRKGVDRLDVPGAGIAVPLAYADHGHQVVDRGVDADLLQHHLTSGGLHRCAKVRSRHRSSSVLLLA